MAAQTRDKGSGSVYQRPDGKWMAQVELPRSPEGKRRYRRTTHSSKGEAKQALRSMTSEAESGIVPDRNTSVSVFVDRWLTDIAPIKVTPGTVQAYRKVFRNWIEPYIGSVKLGDLTPDHVVMMLNDLEADGRAPRTRQYAKVVLGRALRWAEQTHKIPRNPVSLVDGPKMSKRAKDAMTADEAKRVLAEAQGDRWEALAVLALKLGLRQGELLRLRWDDVDLDAGELMVRTSKTEAGEDRTIPLVNGTADVLKAHKRRQQQDSIVRELRPGFVFAWEDGRPMAVRTCIKWWHGLTERALGERRRFHSSRHTCATLLLDAGVPVEVVSAVLGHKDISTTINIYSKTTNNLKRQALRRLDDVLENGNSNHS